MVLTQRTPTPGHRSGKGILKEEKAMKKEYTIQFNNEIERFRMFKPERRIQWPCSQPEGSRSGGEG